jgi:hypothetical protein
MLLGLRVFLGLVLCVVACTLAVGQVVCPRRCNHFEPKTLEKHYESTGLCYSYAMKHGVDLYTNKGHEGKWTKQTGKVDRTSFTSCEDICQKGTLAPRITTSSAEQAPSKTDWYLCVPSTGGGTP